MFVTYDPSNPAHKKAKLFEIKSTSTDDGVEFYNEPSNDKEQADVTPWFFVVDVEKPAVVTLKENVN